jgi:hypothetical protein
LPTAFLQPCQSFRLLHHLLDGANHIKRLLWDVVVLALDHLLEARMERGPIDEEEALRLLDEWWAGRRGGEG